MRVIIPDDDNIEEILLDLSDCYQGSNADYVPANITEFMLLIPRKQINTDLLNLSDLKLNPLLNKEFALQLEESILSYVSNLQDYIDDLNASGIKQDDLSKRYSKTIERILKSKITKCAVVHFEEDYPIPYIRDRLGNTYLLTIDSISPVTNRENLNIVIAKTFQQIKHRYFIKDRPTNINNNNFIKNNPDNNFKTEPLTITKPKKQEETHPDEILPLL